MKALTLFLLLPLTVLAEPATFIDPAGWSTPALYDYLDDKPRSRIR